VRAIRIVLANGEVIQLRRGEHLIDSSNLVRLHHLDGTTTDIPIPTYERTEVKCATGYYSKKNMDLLDAFVGSEGTLGIITSIEVSLQKKPQTAMFLAFFRSIDDAIAFVIQLRAVRSEVLTFHSLEYLDANSLRLLQDINEERKWGMKLPNGGAAAILSEFEYNKIEEAVQYLIEQLHTNHSMVNNAISGIDERDKERLRILRHSIPEGINRIIAQRKKDIPGLHKLGTDTAVPDEHLVDIMKLYNNRLEESGLDYYVIGHIAENHLHVNILPRSLPELEAGQGVVRRLAQDAVMMGGVVSAEHGIGKLKRDFMRLMFGEMEIQQMIATKRAIDPNWIMSRGNIFNAEI
jgi:D-lactate dehydrogenase (cytochrome)